ncbi:hypothetical protein SCHPADRAFT_911564 [Schizopora paradoxa]|uniref:Uncharacterized protein n=1 Tax=Schizopora paradoxa TaxID=27342 RepID=A0A0H2QYD5_9AGAM|nr:hypothetical protein SCHPADRAFT_911564 [Schizopora paradoxa]
MAEELHATRQGMSGSPALVPYHQRLGLTAAGEDDDDLHTQNLTHDGNLQTPNLTRGIRQQCKGTIVDVQFASARNIASKLLATQEDRRRSSSTLRRELTLSGATRLRAAKYWRTSTRVSKQQRKGGSKN